ncbi:hypothetical protein CO174_03595 [Candidatus Uhrbacteria bacterium CG_4_9_14_3_um_filter_50_9]|uniref:Uncharacterized protein n=1 Tax=Candidatus Uhrbacteria bacterium CG_4_9_14_3_um_filter_50_9 TaxID=1975035 RepID=A0A2M7XBW9_9BACT|nr:MAG: hypothetical protein CO174_03595 [Candidatus Uhrbacteria bacterium CG_4_9_14_3_um_filter_50_9]
MIWKQRSVGVFEQIAKTGFLTSLTSYALFWLMDLLKPGFVSRYFSVHIFLLCGLVFGVWWASLIDEYTEHVWVQWLLAIVSGFPLAVLIWASTDGLGGYQLPLAIMSFFIPLLLLRVLRS